ncbi:MAG: glycosyltransferase 87 family protein, partial [Actinomycetota bacterium]|nr:glycosyltransferase 87 family protein [Actinomycetota bacterium]
AIVAPQPALSTTLSVFALVFFGLSLTSLPSDAADEARWTILAAMTVPILSLTYQTAVPDAIVAVRLPGIILGLVACMVAFLAAEKRMLKSIAVGVALCSALVVTGGLIASEWDSELGTDSYHAHRSAGAALIDGLDPYTDAVQILNGSPYVPDGTIIEGYPYPPVVLFTYGLVAAFTDPRLVSTLAWLVVLVWAGWAALSRLPGTGWSLGLFLLLATAPGWPFVWYSAWTEPLTLALFLLAVLAWRRGPLISGILLGLALASKQYLVFLAPLLLLHRDEDWLKRLVTTALTVLATLLPAILIDPVSFYQATIGNLAGIGARPDSQSISGLLGEMGVDFDLPQWAWFTVGLGAATLMGLKSRSSSLFLGRGGWALGVAFVVGLAFLNYWFLVFGMLALSTILDERRSSHVMATGWAHSNLNPEGQ